MQKERDSTLRNPCKRDYPPMQLIVFRFFTPFTVS
jgi:hypothetical protein